MLEYLDTATKNIPFRLVSATDYITPVTGVSSPTIYYNRNVDFPNFAYPCTGGTWTELEPTYMPGCYNLSVSSGALSTFGQTCICVTVSASGCIPSTMIFGVTSKTESDINDKVLTLPYDTWHYGWITGAGDGSDFARHLHDTYVIISSKLVVTSAGATVYQRNGSTPFGIFTWNNGTYTRTKMTW